MVILNCKKIIKKILICTHIYTHYVRIAMLDISCYHLDGPTLLYMYLLRQGRYFSGILENESGSNAIVEVR